MSGPMHPPRLARAVLERAVPADLREQVAADLDEMYRRRAEVDGLARARWWYRRQALSFAVRFGWERLRERPRDEGPKGRKRRMRMGFSWLDFKLGARMLLRYPGLSLIGGAALAVAMAMGVFWFEFVAEELNPDLPLDDGDRVVRVENWDTEAAAPELRALWDYGRWRDGLRTVEELGAARTAERNLIAPDVPPRPVPMAEITANAFPLTRVPPLMGRPLLPSDEAPGAPWVVVLGHALWQGHFEADPDIVGRTVQFGVTEATVVGVMPEGFAFPRIAQAWLPLRTAEVAPGEGPPVTVFGRLAEGASLEEAQAEIEAFGRRTAGDEPATHARLRPRVVPLASDVDPSGVPMVVWVAHLGALLVLFAVSANVATLMFARTAMRESEIVVRTALGAGRRRIIGQLLVESLVLSSAAALVGCALAWGLSRFIWYQATTVRRIPQPFWRDDVLEWSTLAYAGGLAILGAVVVGLLPGLKATGKNLKSGLSEIAAGGSGLSFGGIWSVVIVAQVAFTVICLPVGIGATRETLNDHRVRSDFASQGYFTFRVDLDRTPVAGTGTGTDGDVWAARVEDAHRQLERRLLEEPAVAAVTFGSALPGTSSPLQWIEAQRGMEAPVMVNANTEGMVRVARVGEGYFDTFDLSLLEGRSFTSADAGPGTAIVNESLAQNLGGNPLGMRVRAAASGEAEPGPWHEVVGVVRNANMDPTARGEADFLYLPTTPADAYPAYVALRIRGTGAGLGTRVREIALALDPGLRVYDPLPLDEVVRRRDLPNIMASIGATVVVTLAILLAASGLFALMSVAVERRTREIGIRVALGAGARGVLKAVFTRAAWQLGIGIVLGNLVVAAAGHWLAAGIESATLFVPMLGVSGLMAAVGAAACAVPAWRALRVQPTVALKGVE